MPGLNNMSLKRKLIAAFALVLIIPCLLIGIISYQTARSSMQNELLASAEDTVDLMNQSVEQYIRMEMGNVQGLAKQLTSTAIDEKVRAPVKLPIHLLPPIQSLNWLLLATKTEHG